MNLTRKMRFHGNTAMSMAFIHIVEDDADVRHSLQCILETPARSVITHACAHDFLATFQEEHPCCLILDYALPGLTGLELLERLRARQLRLPTIMITGAADTPMVLRLMRLGVVDICLKPVDPRLLLPLVEQTLARETRRLALLRRVAEARRQLTALTPRERELFQLVVEGKSNKEMGATLGISPRTVEHHRAHIAAKLGLDRVTDLVRLDIFASVDATFSDSGEIPYPVPAGAGR